MVFQFNRDHRMAGTAIIAAISILLDQRPKKTSTKKIQTWVWIKTGVIPTAADPLGQRNRGDMRIIEAEIYEDGFTVVTVDEAHAPAVSEVLAAWAPNDRSDDLNPKVNVHEQRSKPAITVDVRDGARGGSRRNRNSGWLDF